MHKNNKIEQINLTKYYNIGVEATMDVIGGKWKPIILCNLKNGPLRPSDLKRRIPDISQKMLIAQLRELEISGIVIRHVFPEVPPHVEYSLSEYGQTLSPVLEQLCKWGESHVKNLQKQGEKVELLCCGHLQPSG